MFMILLCLSALSGAPARAFDLGARHGHACRRFSALDRVEPGGERVELRLPVFAVAVDPHGGLIDRSGIETAAADPAGALLRHEPGAPRSGERRVGEEG